jgi:hypothetical protein
MTALVWDSVGSRFFEAGIDRGVLYSYSIYNGIPWNGLTSVTEQTQSPDVSPLYFNGKKHFDFVGPEEFSATIKAFTYPDEFLELNGIATAPNGVQIAGQQRKSFGLSFRTIKGNDVSDSNLGYKIHVLYDLIATPSDIDHASISDSFDPIEFEWSVTSRPQTVGGYKPVSHLIIDSTKIEAALLTQIETLLYGSSTSFGRLPSALELVGLLAVGYTITVIDNGDGTWTATGPDNLITFTNATTFQIDGINSVVIDANTYQISST